MKEQMSMEGEFCILRSKEICTTHAAGHLLVQQSNKILKANIQFMPDVCFISKSYLPTPNVPSKQILSHDKPRKNKKTFPRLSLIKGN